MENINEKILEDYRLLVARLDIIRAEVSDMKRRNNKLHTSFIELLEVYQLELERRDSIEDRQNVNYHWLEKAGVLD